MRPIGLIIALLAGLLMAGCVGMPLHGAPPADSPRATLSAVNHLGANDADYPNRVRLFKVDGVQVAKLGGAAATAVAPGNHRIKLFADHNGVLRFATLCGDFVAGADYTLTVTSGQGPAYPYQVTLSRDGDDAALARVDF